MLDLPSLQRNPSLIGGYAAAHSDERAAAAFLREVWSLIRSGKLPEHVQITTLKSIRPIGTDLLTDFLSDHPVVYSRALADNPALTDEHASFIANQVLGRMEEGMRAKDPRPADAAGLVEGLYKAGKLRAESPETERILRMAERLPQSNADDASRIQHLRTQYAEGCARVLARIADLSEAQLLRFGNAALDDLTAFGLENLVTSSAANIAFWRLIARRIRSPHSDLLGMLRQIPPARRDPEVRAVLEEWLLKMDGFDAGRMLSSLCADETERAPERFRFLAQQHPWLAAELLDDPEFAGLHYLKPVDLAPILASEHQEARLRAIVAQSRIAGVTPEHVPVPIRSSWQSRYENVSLPF